jgi:hypothetical protein
MRRVAHPIASVVAATSVSTSRTDRLCIGRDPHASGEGFDLSRAALRVTAVDEA